MMIDHVHRTIIIISNNRNLIDVHRSTPMDTIPSIDDEQVDHDQRRVHLRLDRFHRPVPPPVHHHPAPVLHPHGLDLDLDLDIINQDGRIRVSVDAINDEADPDRNDGQFSKSFLRFLRSSNRSQLVHQR